MNKILKNSLFPAVSAILLAVLMFGPRPQVLVEDEPNLGLSTPDAQWQMVGSFQGYQTELDESKLPNGANGRGQNTTANNQDRISIRQQGIELFPKGTASTSLNRISSIHTFRKKTGENIMLRAYSTVLEYYEETGDEWTILKTGYTEDQKFGFADYQKANEASSFTYFGNAVEDFSRWTGVHTQLTQDVAIGTTTIHVADINDLDDFDSTGTIVICGNEHAYSSRTQTTFTLSATTTNICANGTGIPEAVEEFDTNPKGNIYLAFDNRILISGVASTTQAVFFSAYGEPTDYLNAALVSASTDADADIFNLVEGGGPVTGLAMDENALYIFKRSIIYKVTLTDTDYNVTQLKPFDGRSQTTGLTSERGAFSGGNQVFFVTPDNQIMQIGRVENVDVPQIVPISEVIKNTVDSMKFDTATGIVFRDRAYFSVKSSTDASTNDTVLIWNIKEKIWDSPLVGWNAEDFIVYDDGTSEELYIANSISPNVYKVNNIIADDIFEVKANWRSKQFDFDAPQSLKSIEDVYVEGYITPNTTLTISLLLDEDGVSQVFSTDFVGTEEDYIFSADEFNLFGFSAFGSKRFGSGGQADAKRKFRMYLDKDFRPVPFYNAQIEFASEGVNNNWEITNFGMNVRPYTQPQKRQLFRSFQ